MTKRENKALVKSINYIKAEWVRAAKQRAEAPKGSNEQRGWGRAGGESQAYSDSLLGIVHSFRLGIPVNMTALPEDTVLDTSNALVPIKFVSRGKSRAV